ncbi:hypothetical protein J4G52_25125 [Burkholderia cenocepacia]|uniref:hypothetical protein n=1 Tax=Burkholderia cenocepacia TaxID=95486 RepID=UPI001AA1C350|nr:hypothetical protein [Burkholderia cenocepacia]MBO1856825.1 hypothetical protein [Burkholderia cenocepacia]
MSTIIQGPTMANPDAFNTVAELREQLHRTNDMLLSVFFMRAQLEDGANQMAGLINMVLLAHLQGDQAEIGRLLTSYLADRAALREKLEERMESDRIRTTH